MRDGTGRRSRSDNYPRANGAKPRSGRKPGARVTKSAPSEVQSRCRWAMGIRFFMVCHDVMPTDLNNMADYRVEWF